MKTLFEALNIAYREREKRSFVSLNLLSFVFTIGFMLLATLLIAVVGILPALLALLPVDEFTDLLLRYARWPLLLLVAGLANRDPLPLRPQPRNAPTGAGSVGAACLPASSG